MHGHLTHSFTIHTKINAELSLNVSWCERSVTSRELSWLLQGIQLCCFACKISALTMEKTEKKNTMYFLKGFLSKVPCKLHTTDPWIHRFNAWCFSKITQTFITWNKLELGWSIHMNFRAGGWCAWMEVTQPEDYWQSFCFSLPFVTYTETQYSVWLCDQLLSHAHMLQKKLYALILLKNLVIYKVKDRLHLILNWV